MSLALDHSMVKRGLASSRTQAINYIKLGIVTINRKIIEDPSYLVSESDEIKLQLKSQYVSRAALKLESVASVLNLNFSNKQVLDVGSSTGGFTDYALKHGASRVIAVEVGSNQLHPSLRLDKRVELHEQTDIRNLNKLSVKVDIVLVDVSFVSLRDILPALKQLITNETQIIAMFKPQFEADKNSKNRGIIKNNKIRRDIIRNFELWITSNNFIILNKADSKITGAMGNLERFYLLKLVT